ncbi:dystroglycan-like isoform X1 [Anneissia japonica]|uniref:dystroglycan-like isoform X1 n=1 Tax=Anneissia japonica TaxID=1529436 RepID=UPI0014258069|nr:dystroglycan-like isoform X1 [Anneissia japonica]XP_033110610.1 dystroglycan-like isoform X1 [Anneissia japonica]XP_033110611.1 dystroglycan-like isoform X2 [Anneissia japonica]XP_033110612.1 dystroglycan-like isoform X1 [Anneissia japonica]
MVMDLGRTSFFYHRPLNEHLLQLFVVFICIWMTFCSKDLWVFDHNSTGDMQTKLTLRDKIAVVGKVFLYHILYKNEERSSSLQVTEAGSESLPDWLKFNRDDSTLYGIATVQDIGYHYISVTITSMNNESSRINFRDVFTVDVILSSPAAEESNIGFYDNFNSEPFIKLTYEPRLEPCTPNQPRFSATIIISTSFQQLNGQERVEIVLRFAKYVFRSPVDLTLSPRKSASITRLLKKSIVAAGPGNIDGDSKEEEGVEITWTLTCNSQFHVDYFTRIMEHNILSGTLVDVIGYSVLGWYITRDEPKIKPLRFRRQANDIINETPVPTPSQTMVLPTKVQSTVSFSFPSTLINFDSTVTIEFTQSTLIRTVNVSSASSFMTSSPFSSSPVVLTSSPAFASSSSDAISDIVMTMFSSGSISLQTFLTFSPFSTSPVFQMSTSSVVTTLEPASSFIPGLTASIFNETVELSSTTYVTISPSIPYLPFTFSPVALSSQTNPEMSSSAFRDYSSMQTSFTTYDSTSMFTEPSTFVVRISTESLTISSLLLKSDLSASSLVKTSVPETLQLITSSEFEVSTTPLLSSMLTPFSSFMSPSMSSEFYSPHETLSSTQFQLYSSTYSPSSSFFYRQMLTSSFEYNLATSSLLEEYSFPVSFTVSSSQLSTPVSSRLMELSTMIIPSSFSQSVTIDSRVSSVLPTSSLLASSVKESSISLSSASSSAIPSSSFEGYLTSSPSLVTSSSMETSDVFLTMSPTLPLSILPSVSISSKKIEIVTSSLKFTLSSSQLVSTSIYFSSSLMSTSKFITPMPSSFPPLTTVAPSMHPTPALSTSFMAPSIKIPLTSVQQMISSEIMPTPSISSVMISSSLLVTPEPVNQGPVVLNAINHITILIGRVLTFNIPADTFYDPEDGDTRNLALELLTGDNQPIEGSSWVRLDAKLQIIYGLALDTMLIDQKIVYNLFATDSEGKNVFDALYIEVVPDPYVYTHQFLITFSNNYDDFSRDVNNAIDVCQRLADYYGDPSTDKITVLSISEGSVVYVYANNSISNRICDMDAINREYSRLAYANGSVNVGVKIVMQPKYPVVSVQKHLKGVCLLKPQTTNVPNVISEIQRSSKQIVSITIPAFLCALLLLLIGICVCCCYKRKRHGEEFLLREERDMFVRNRKPIFLDNELEPRLTKATKPVVLPKDISPFQPSPRTGSAPLESRPSPPSYLNEAYEKDDPDNGIPMPFFPPPAYSLQPTFNRLPLSYLDPPGYRLPPAYESEDVGMFETSKI